MNDKQIQHLKDLLSQGKPLCYVKKDWTFIPVIEIGAEDDGTGIEPVAYLGRNEEYSGEYCALWACCTEDFVLVTVSPAF